MGIRRFLNSRVRQFGDSLPRAAVGTGDPRFRHPLTRGAAARGSKCHSHIPITKQVERSGEWGQGPSRPRLPSNFSSLSFQPKFKTQIHLLRDSRDTSDSPKFTSYIHGISYSMRLILETCISGFYSV